MSFAKLAGVNLHYQILGDGAPTVIFLHGLVMDNLSSWFFTIANSASQKSRVLLYDLRGHGYSERPVHDYGIDQHLNDLNNLLEEAKIEGPIILVGNSFGGLLSINFAQKYPSRVQGLVLVDAQVNNAAWKEQMSRSLMLEGEERNRLIGENFQNWLGRNSRRKSNRLAKNAEELVYKTDLIKDLNASRVLSEEELKNISIPTLAIYGADSDVLSVGKNLERLLLNCELKIFEGCTHSVLWQKTEELKSQILNWLLPRQT